MNYKKYAFIDLHLHLDGSLSPEAIIKVAKKENIALPTFDRNELIKFLEVPSDCESLNDYLKRFELPNLALQTEYGLQTCTDDLLKRLSNQGLKYVEIRMAPQLSINKGLSQEKVVEIILKTLKNAEKYRIFSNLILCMMRGNDTHEKNLETVRVAKKFLGKGVVAMDLAGAEALFPNEMFEEEFALINKYNIPLTIHAGEAFGSSSVMSALTFGARRIGHGIHSIEDEKVLFELKKRNVCLEICPKSNLDTKTIASYTDLPIKRFIDSGIKITINTDDMTVSGTTLIDEYKTLEKMGLKCENFEEFAINSINFAFCNSEIKKQLLDYFNKQNL